MTSGPYQSKLLRLVIAQYRQGVDRHHRAVRQARSTAVLGVELGTVLALAPVSAAIKGVQNAGARVRRAVAEGGLFALTADAMKTDSTKLLDFSDFEAAATEPEDVTELASLTGSILAEGSMVQTLRTVGLCLSSRQVKALAQSGCEVHRPSESSPLVSMPFVGRLVSFGRRSVAGLLRRMDVQDSELANAGGEITAQTHGLAALKVTGVASDVETRSLHLVLGNTIAWYGLSARQQARLQQKILCLLEGDIEQRSFLSTTFSVLKARPAIALFGQQSALARPMTALWLGVWRALLRRRRTAITWLKQQPLFGPMDRTAERQEKAEALSSPVDELAFSTTNPRTLTVQAPSASLRVGSEAARTAILPLVSALVRDNDGPLLKENCVAPQQDKAAQKIVDLVSQGLEGTQSQRRQADYWEADVIAIDYIEHPLETVLKWVDRILLWIEAQWQALKSWLSRLEN